MADRSVFKQNLKYHRIVVICIVTASIWMTYQYSSADFRHNNGQSRVSGQHINGKDEGTWTWYYDNGKSRWRVPLFMENERDYG